jgi:hypothetical protein
MRIPHAKQLLVAQRRPSRQAALHHYNMARQAKNLTFERRKFWLGEIYACQERTKKPRRKTRQGFLG